MAKVLTAVSVEKLKPDPAKRHEVPDGGLPGLYIIIQPSGRKSWAVRYRHGAKTRKLTLSPGYPALGLADARQRAGEELRKASEGADPAGEKRLRRVVPDPGRDLVSNVVGDFLKRHVVNARWRHEVERMLTREVLPTWGERRIQDITRRDVIDLLDGLTDRGVGTMTNRVFSVVRKLCNWSIERDILTTSPCAGLRPPVPEVSRDRVLDDDELRWLWKAAVGLSYPFGPLVQLLALTGQRKSEVGDAGWSEFNLGERRWTIPKERAKNGNPHDVPLSDQALVIVEALPRIKGRVGYLFTTTGESPVSGFSRAKDNLDKAMLAIARGEAEERGDDPDEVTIPDWRLHDIRRTVASGMARLAINLPVIEKVLAHTSGSFAGIVGVYQRHSFAAEKGTALDAWGRFVETTVGGRPAANVVALRKAGS